MLSWYKQQTSYVKLIILIVLLISTGIAWWLVSPLFLPGQMSAEEIDVNDPNVDVILTGELVMLDSSHWGEGTVRIVNTTDGDFAIQFIDVEIANGPSLKVYLSDKANFDGINDSPGSYVDLGDLPANSGSFSVDIDMEPTFDINSVLIWCEPFQVVFTYATMT